MAFDTDTIKFWMDAAGRYPLLHPQQVLILAKQIQQNPPESKIRQRAIQKLIRHNLKLIPKIARKAMKAKYGKNFGSTYTEDVLQCGVLGLSRAAELYDPTRGYAFSTYAIPWIFQAITRDMCNNISAIRVPENTIREHYNAFRNIQSPKELLEIKEKKLHRYWDAFRAINCKSSDSMMSKKTGEDIDVEGTYMVSDITNEVVDDVDDLLSLSKTSDLSVELVKAHFIENTTIKELGRIHNMSRNQVAKIIKDCLLSIRDNID